MPHILDTASVNQIIDEVTQTDEKDRRQSFRRRGRIYKDGGKDFLIEHLTKEFGVKALNEMRLAPINVLKSWVDRKSIIYSRPPVRKTESKTDQALMDAYVERTAFDMQMQKANRYFNLYSNCELYTLPKTNRDGTKEPMTRVMPPWLYSVSTEAIDPTEKDVIVYSSFADKDDSLERKEINKVSLIQESAGVRTGKPGQGIDAKQASMSGSAVPYIFWTDLQHFTVFNGAVILDEANPDGLNPIGLIPSVTLRKDVDNEFWAMQGEDQVDMAIATQLMFTDQLTIAKMQGFALLVITSKRKPDKMEVGLQKAIHMKVKDGEPTPTVSYLNANAPLTEYSDLAARVLEVSSQSNLLPPSTFGGSKGGDPNSGVQEMIRNSSTLMEIESQKPVLRDAELETWERYKRWHNLLHDKNELPKDLKALGKFSDDFAPVISYQDMKPVESEEQRLKQVQMLMDMGMLTRKKAMKKLNPEMSDEQIETEMKDIEEEKQARVKAFTASQPAPAANPFEKKEPSGGA